MARLRRALAEVNRTQKALASIAQCLSHWPSDLPGPGYLGTRCDLLAGHAPDDPEDQGVDHRARVRGSQVVLRW